MAIDYNLVTISGTSPGNEIWTTSCAYQSDGGTGPAKDYGDLNTWANAIAALPGADFRALCNAASEVAPPLKVRVAWIDATGITAQYAEAQLGSGWDAVGTAVMPFQCAAVISLLTGRPGRSYRGRMYWPIFSAAIAATTLQLPGATTVSYAEAAAAMLTDIGTAAGVDLAMKPCVASKKLGITDFITQVRVGTVVDTQRRRRNQAQESYSYSPVPAV